MERYFIPDISSLHVGYECEVFNLDENLWEDFVVTKDYCLGILSQWIDFKELRTSFLTKEQIEEEGFQLYQNNGGYELFFKTEKKNNQWWEIDFNTETHIVEIDKYNIVDGNTDFITLYKGKIPSINEFKTLLKWLRIK